ncbi:aminoacyl-tRNA hydrolase [Lacticaseibacillus nasuensis]|uniref:aminoacyl-tRNA hydrolase n=1 Tax=Lacticaseibacillus nasuensis TaxID=944671 RepID=UPI002246C34C|nr:aminoacyl-tRNA hydrolase [Lacticaseibacillus nasuensis]MCX2456434.1 aminoacyl-tRNA hydrolase [Lacticaseibacillus nasuensis]
MKMIVGLGNPGSKYEQTKHNIGFMTVAALAKQLDVTLSKHEFNAITGTAHVGGEKVLLVQPQTFMNDSGRAVGELKAFYQFHDDEIMIIQDDMDMAMGRVRLRQRGSAGGHNGIKSIINVLGTQDFYRLKIGIQHPQKQRVVDWVLTPFNEADAALINAGIDRACAALTDWINGETVAQLMNQYN